MYVLAIRDPQSRCFRLIERETGHCLYVCEGALLPLLRMIDAEGHTLKLAHGSYYHPVYGQCREGFFWPSGRMVAGLPSDWHLGLLHPGDVRFHPNPDGTFLRAEWTGTTWMNEQVVKAPLPEGVYTFLLSPDLGEHEVIDFRLCDSPTTDRYYRPRLSVINSRLTYEGGQRKE